MTASAYLLLIETSVILETDANTWQAIANLGECFLPEIVAIEIKNVANGKVDGNESAAKQFQNLLPKLGWQITPLTAKHPDLLAKTSQNLSRKAKLILNTAQSAIGVAHAYPQQCVVLISDEILLRDRLAKLDYKNLCAIPSAIARQWSRTDQLPPIVQKTIKYLATQRSSTDLQSVGQPPTMELKPTNSHAKLDQNTSVSRQPSSSKNGLNYRQITISLVKFGLSTAFLVTILLFGWQLAQPQQFQQFWKKIGLPTLPKTTIVPKSPPKN